MLLTFLVFPVALRLFDYRPDLIAESWRYISWVLSGYMLAIVYIPVRNGVIALATSTAVIALRLRIRLRIPRDAAYKGMP